MAKTVRPKWSKIITRKYDEITRNARNAAERARYLHETEYCAVFLTDKGGLIIGSYADPDIGKYEIAAGRMICLFAFYGPSDEDDSQDLHDIVHGYTDFIEDRLQDLVVSFQEDGL